MIVDGGQYRARFASSANDVARAQAFRGDVFRAGGKDADAFDALYQHILIETDDGQLAGCFRALQIADGDSVGASYAAQFYDLDQFAALDGAKMEVGRFCVDPSANDPELLRIAWAAITQIVDAGDVRFLFGCSSFSGTDAGAFRDAFALLRARHLAPHAWRPRVKAAQTYAFATELADVRPSLAQATKAMPSLLRTYLSLGGVVSDHAVVDQDLNTLHVFTSVAIATIPERRKQALRDLIS